MKSLNNQFEKKKNFHSRDIAKKVKKPYLGRFYIFFWKLIFWEN
jgi:hypothetical protein